MFLCSLAVCILAGSQKLTFNEPAASLRVVLDRLSVATGQKLAPGGDIAHEVVLICATDTTADEVKRQIAKAMHASWSTKDGLEILDRTPQQKNDIWQQHLAARSDEVQTALAGLKKEVEKPFDAKMLARELVALPDAEDVSQNPSAARARYEKEKQLFAAGPLGRLIRKLILACDQTDLAAIGPFERRVYRMKPNRRQGKINEAAFRKAVAEFAKEQAAWSDVASNTTFPAEKSGRMVSDPRTQANLAMNALQDCQLVVRRSEAVALFHVNLVGNRDDSVSGVLTQLSVEDKNRKFINSLDQQPMSEKDPEVKLSPESKVFAAAIAPLFSNERSKSPTPETLEMLANLDKTEPLAWTVTDLLQTYAQHHKKNVVAALPDQAMLLLSYASRGPIRLNQGMASLTSSGTLEVKSDAEWVTITPPDRWESAIDFTPRSAMAKLLKDVMGKGRMDIRDYATYAFDSKRLNRGGIADIFLGIYDRSLLGLMDFASWDGLRLYGSLTPNGRRDLEQGKSFSYAGMNLAQKALVGRIIYSDIIQSEERLNRGMSQMHGKPIEPTDTFANGVPSNTEYFAKTTSTEAIVAYGKDQYGKNRILRGVNAWTLAHILENPSSEAQYGMPDLVGFAPGVDRMFSMRLLVAPGVWKEMPLLIPDYDDKAEPKPWTKLPDLLKSQVAAAIEQLRQQRKNQAGTGTPPP